MDLQQGLLCGLTGKVADFEGECPDYKHDESVKQMVYQEEPEIGSDRAHELLSGQPLEVLEAIRAHQDITFAVIGGLLAALVGAVLWATVTVSTGYQIGYMAIAVGLIVGFAVRYFGAGVDSIFGVIGAAMALLGCLLGNLFSQVVFLADAYGIGYFETLGMLDINTIISIYTESFSVVDLFFYGLAIYEGYKFAFRSIDEEMLVSGNFAPPATNLRLPLAGAAGLALAAFMFLVNKDADGIKEFHYENGNVMSKGNLVDGLEEGIWEYYDESGQLVCEASYQQGEAVGEWKWFNDEGGLARHQSYANGLLDGPSIQYYDTGEVMDSGAYEYGRKTGLWMMGYPTGAVSSRGSYQRDSQQGLWKLYHENGNLNQEGNYLEGDLDGLWTFWDSTGNKRSERFFKGKDVELRNAWDAQGSQIVKDGNGVFKKYYLDQVLQQEGPVVDGKESGEWVTYFPDGSLQSVFVYEGGEAKIVKAWDPEGNQIITEGAGHYQEYNPELGIITMEGSFEGGLRTGVWVTYSEMGTVYEETQYNAGKREGAYIQYFEQDAPRISGNFVNDEADGLWEWFYNDGTPETTVTFVAGKKEGEQVFWSMSDRKAKIETYQNGELISEEIL